MGFLGIALIMLIATFLIIVSVIAIAIGGIGTIIAGIIIMKKFWRKFLKYIVTACGIILLATIMLPGILNEYRPFAVLFLIGNCLLILVAALALIAFLNATFKKQKSQITETEKSTFILHDLPPEIAESLFSHLPNITVFCAAQKLAPCKGFYDCWLKEPGVCAFHDSAQNLGIEVAQHDNFVIVSKSLYGGLSREVKNVLDRAVSFALPFFLFRNNELHHQIRHDKKGTMQVYIYNAYALSEIEKSSVSGLVTAMGVNLDKQNCETIFINDAMDLKEVLA